jgi:aldose 1-epimerase|nr:aldose 1-epimerase [uncultured Caldimonas sp.]
MTPTPPTLELRAGALRLAVRPDLGGSIAGLWHHDVPVLRSTEPSMLDNVRLAACYPLVPYSNRIEHARFPWAGRQVELARSVHDDGPHALHGVGLYRAWQVLSSDEGHAELRLQHPGDEAWPFAFEVTQRMALDAQGLALSLQIVNTAAEPAPAGLGWHPFFPKRSRSRLHAELSGRWDADETLLPVRHVPQAGIDADVAYLDFDNCFTGWQGTVRIRDEKFSLQLTSPLPYLVVYTPPLREHFAVEPVSHVNNALNMPEPEQHGVAVLAPGASLSATMKLNIQEVHA